MILQLVFGALLLWVISQFYWLRVIACGLLLAIWGGFALVAPLGLALGSFVNGDPFVGIMQIALGGLMGGIWLIGAKGARDWLREQQNFDRLWKPWNAK